MARPRKPRRRLPWVVGAGILLAAGVVVAYFALRARPGDVSNPNVEFQVGPTTPAPARHRHRPKTVQDPGFSWPVYGYDAARTRFLALQRPLRPPYRQVWKIRAHALLEFPPVLAGQSMFLLKDNGSLIAIKRRTGRILWSRKLGTLAASSPAVANGSVYVVLLERSASVHAGRVVALNARSGRVRWSRPLASRAESSPLLDHGTLYFGSENGTVYALRARNGATRWRYQAAGAVKGGLAEDNKRRLFFGDYAGKVYSLRASDGHERWTVSTSGGRFGRSGQFYATASLGFGRVYLGNTDGFVYSFAATSGRLAWRIHTGGYVYGSAAVALLPGDKPTVFVGSYDRSFYALDARSGAKRWVRDAGGRVSGGSVLLGGIVWFSTLERQTRALSARTGRLLYTANKGQFNPVVSDGRRIYLVGSSTLSALQPRGAAAQRAGAHERRAARSKARRG